MSPKLRAAALLLPLLVYAVLAGRRIGAGVGYQMDEALYVESAVYMLRGSGEPPFVHEAGAWIAAGGRRWPLMIIPYVGAAKAYVALPLFAAFGIGAETARATGALLGALGISGLTVLVGSMAGWLAALVTGLLLAIHPSYLDLTVFDHGGSAVWMGAMGLLAFALTVHFRRRSAATAFLVGLAAGLGVWGRANFVWLLAAALLAAVVVSGRRGFPTAREVLSALAGALAGAAPLLVYELRSRAGTLHAASAMRQPFSAGRPGARLGGMAELMVSSRQLRAIWGGPGTQAWEIALGAALLVLVAVALVARIPGSDPSVSSVRRAFALATLALTAILVLSGLPVGQHHMLAVLPLALASVTILGVELGRRSKGAAVVFIGLAAAAAAVSVGWDVRIDRGLRETEGRGVWSSALFRIRDRLEAERVAPERFKILDWGYQNNLYVVSGGKVSGTELFWGATPARSSRGVPWSDEIRGGGVFLRTFGSTSPASEGFARALREDPGEHREVVFRDLRGDAVASLVEIAPRP
ncbi:MAG TPA: hypothetical protein VKG23_11575 [Thermoanaerobaculia bacterium]|nr:hypothetical protein [Thermoanaerobaculia bacterium]